MLKKLISILSVAAMLAFSVQGLPGSAAKAPSGKLQGEPEKLEGLSQKAELNYASEGDMLLDMSLAAQNGSLELYISEKNLSVAVKNTATGEIFTSNPYNAASDPMCTGEIEKNLESQIILSFHDADYKKQNLWSSADCLEFGQYSIELYENGAAFNLSLGEEKGEQLVPIALAPRDFEGYLEKLDRKQQRKLNAFYTLYAEGEFFDTAKLEQYPELGKHELYVLDGELSDRERSELSEIFIAAGYTSELYEKDMASLGIKTEKLIYPNFKLRIEYVLTDSGLEVTIPNESIVCSEGYQLLEISLLPYFGCDKPIAGGKGYILVPDGSGALININNQVENRQTAIAGRVYGDNPVTDDVDYLSEGRVYHLPVFGILRNNGSAFSAITLSGDAADYIVALLGGPNGSYYNAYNRFIYTEYEPSQTEPKLVSAGSTRAIYISDKNAYKCNYSVLYSFLSGDRASYAGMAEVYREYLKNQGMKPEASGSTASASVTTLGSALIDKSFLGFKYRSEAVFTSFESNIEILKDLKEKGVENVSLSLKGWEKNGLDASVSNKLRFSSRLGGKGDFGELAKYCKDNGIRLSLENEFVFSKYDRLFDGISSKKSMAQTLEEDIAYRMEYRSFAELEESRLSIITPKVYEKLSGGLFKSAEKNGVASLTLNSIGNHLVADFSKRHSINRAQALEEIKKLLSSGSKSSELGFNGANAYVLPYASVINSVPCSHSGLAGESLAVPFLQMVAGGGIRLNSEPINLSGNSNISLLDCLRFGVTPSYIVAAENIEQLKKTDYSRYFAANYKYVSEDIASDYSKVGAALKAIDGSRVKSCFELASGVYLTEYGSGVKLYTNYNSADFALGGEVIAAQSFKMITD